MIPVIPFLLGGGFFIVVFVIVHMLLTRGTRRKEELILGSVLLLCAVNLIHPHLRMLFPAARIYSRYRLFEPMQYVFAPLLYLYIRNIGNNRLDVSFKDLVHLLLPVSVTAFSFSRAAEMLEEFTLLPLASLLFWFIIVIQSFGYMHVSASRLEDIRFGLLQLFSNLVGRSPDWLVWTMRLFFIINVSYLVPIFFLLHTPNAEFSKVYLSAASFILIWAIGLKAVTYRTEGFSKLRKPPHGVISLSNSDIDLIKNALEEQIHIKQLYTNPDLSLDDLVKVLGYSRNEVSWVINNVMGRNFYGLVNEYRVNQVKEMLKRGYKGTILDIAFEAGFNSKPVFNRVFKELTGVTPSVYRKEHVKR